LWRFGTARMITNPRENYLGGFLRSLRQKFFTAEHAEITQRNAEMC
jgi:hypothetical protein